MTSMSSPTKSAQQLMDPRPTCAAIDDANDEEKTREVSVSPTTTLEVMSKESDHIHTPPLNSTNNNNNHSIEDGYRTSQSWGSPKSPRLEPLKGGDEPMADAPFRKARVSVRARSEAPSVNNPRKGGFI